MTRLVSFARLDDASAILRDLCRSSASSWRVSDVSGRVTLTELWQAACVERLGLRPEHFETVMRHLIDRGDVVQDFGRRVYPRQRADR